MAAAIEIMFKGRRLGYFVNPERVPVGAGDHVIVEAERGVDIGQIKHLAVETSPSERDRRFKTILRRAGSEDLRTLARIRKEETEATRICRERISKLRLEMKLIDSESQLDGQRITFYFTAEKRVDFRELVKDLAGIFKTRIELRQIGARDAAKRLGGIGPCGREYCCSTWLKDFSPVTLKMAKNQGLALAPSKISGGCGRLMCCLMYEDPFYKEMVRLFPKHGFRFELDGVPMRVFQNDFFREVVKARNEEGEVQEWPIEEFPVPRERWSGAVRAKGAPGRGGHGSGCHKPDPKPIGMKNARGAREKDGGTEVRERPGGSRDARGPSRRDKDRAGQPEGGARRPRGKIPIQPVEETPASGGAPFMHGGRKRSDREDDAEAPPPADMVRYEAQRRRRADGGEELDTGAPGGSDSDLSDSELVASADPPEGRDRPRTDPPEDERRADGGADRRADGDDASRRDEGGERRPQGRRRRRGRRRRGGSGPGGGGPGSSGRSGGSGADRS